MRFLAFSTRNRKELLRDPLSLIFMLGLPIVLLGLMRILDSAIPGGNPAFAADRFAPGMAVFSLSFLALFLGMLIANDRASSFLSRLFTSPLTTAGYILGYSLPMLGVSVLQMAVCFGAALALGLSFSLNILAAVVVLLPVALLFIALGILFGAWMTLGGVTACGNIIIQVATLMGGTWFSLDMVGGAFRTIGYLLPFAHAVDAARAAVAGDWAALPSHLLWVAGYTAVFYAFAVWGFSRRMRGIGKS